MLWVAVWSLFFAAAIDEGRPSVHSLALIPDRGTHTGGQIGYCLISAHQTVSMSLRQLP